MEVVHALEVRQDVAAAVLHLGVTHSTEEILGVDLTAAILRLHNIQRDPVNRHGVVADVPLLVGNFVTNWTLELAFAPL